MPTSPKDLRAFWEISLLALLVYREAANQPDEAKVAVACSVRNRVLTPCWWGHDWISVALAGKQYSSFNRDDPNSTKFPPSADNVFPRCLAIAAAVHDGEQPDTVDGADSYFDNSLDRNPPSWASSKTFVKDAGAFHFYKTPRAVSA